MADIGTAYIEMRPDFSGFQRQASSGFAKWGKRIGVGLGVAVGAGLAKATASGLNFNATMEQNTVAFKHFLGSTKQATKYLGQLYKLAATTPFEFKDVAQASKQLLAFGFTSKETIANLKNIGDAASGLGTGTEGINRMVLALGQMKVAGVVQGDELRQFQEAGINVYKYMEKAGLIAKSDIGQIGQMHIDSSKAIKAIMDGMQKDFGGMSKAQSRTWKGQLSTMRDYAAQAFGAITKPLFNLGRNKVFPTINRELQKISDWARAGGVDWAIDGWRAKLRPFAQSIGRIAAAFKGGFESPKMPKGLGPFSGLSIGQDKSFIASLRDGVAAGLKQAFNELMNSDIAGGLLKVVSNVLDKVFDPIWIAKHIGDILTVALAVIPIGKITKIPGLKQLADFLWKWLSRALIGLGKTGGRFMVGIGKELVDKLLNSLGRLPAGAQEILYKLWSALQRAGGKLKSIGKGLGGSILDGVEVAGRGFVKLGAKLLGWLASGVRGIFRTVFNLGKTITGYLRDGIASIWKRIYSLGGWLLDKLKDGLIAGVKGLAGIGGKIVSGLKKGIGKGISIPLKLFGAGGAGLAVGKLGHDKGNFGAVNRMAASSGNVITSGYRPGDPGWHGKNRARDYAGGNMMGFAKAVAKRFGGSLLELIHTPLGWGIKNGRKVPLSFWGSAVNADHNDHVHVALRQGGARGGRGQSGQSPKVVWDEGSKREWWISQEGDRKKNTAWALEALQSLTGDRLSLFRKGGTIRGKVSTFGPPLERAGGTAYGRSSADPGIAVNPTGLASGWNGALANSLKLIVGKLTIMGKSIMARVIDKGPNANGRKIDVTGALAKKMGIDPAKFPTDRIGTFTWGKDVKKAGKGRKPAKGLSIFEQRDAVLSHLAAQLVDAEANDDDNDPTTYADNEKILNRRISYVSKIIAKLRKKIQGLAKKMAKRHISAGSKRHLTLQRKKAYDDLANYVGIVNSDRAAIKGFHPAAPPSEPGSGTDDSNLASTLRALLEQSWASNRLLAAQLPVFKDFAKYGQYQYVGKLHSGGVVPGPLGAERAAILQAGERVIPIGGGEPQVDVHIHDGAINPSAIEVVFDRKLDRLARTVRSGPTAGMRGR